MKEKGQALILVLVASAVMASVLAAATLAAVSSAKSSYRDTLARQVYYATEAGAEEALIRMERKNPALLGTACPATPEAYTLNSISLSIAYSTPFAPGNNGCLLIVTAQSGNIIKKIQVFAQLDLYRSTKVFSYCCWDEIP